MQESGGKRQRTLVAPCGKPHRQYHHRPVDWRVTIATPQTFKTLLSIVQSVVAHVTFRVCCSTAAVDAPAAGDAAAAVPFSGLRMDAMNSSQVCMVKTAYECLVTSGGDDDATQLENPVFCVETDMLMTLLRDVQACHLVELVRYTGSANLTIHVSDQHDNSSWSISTLQLVEEESTFQELNMWNLTFHYVVEMELDRLKEVCRIVHAIRGSVVELCVEEPEEDDGVIVDATTTATTPPVEKVHYFTVAAESDGVTIRKVHLSNTIPDGGPDVIKVVRGNQVSGDESGARNLKKRFSGVYPAIYLNGVLKSMERKTVQLYLSPGMPLVVHYGLGNDASYVKIVLAPRIVDNDTAQ